MKNRAILTFELCNSLIAQPNSKAANKAIAQNYSSDLSPFPDKSDYLSFAFRQLSATIVGSGTWKSTDFSKPNVLKKSMALLQGVTAFVNHNSYNVLSAIGTVGKPKWDEAIYEGGIEKVPAGISAPFVIDSKIHTDLCRMLNAPEPVINSCSVSIVYEYEPSHAFSKEWEFEDAIGTIAPDGREVTRVVTKIIEYRESSLVGRGADKFAKKQKDDGTIEKMPFSENAKFSDDEFADTYKQNGTYFIKSDYVGQKLTLNFDSVETEKKVVVEEQKFDATELTKSLELANTELKAEKAKVVSFETKIVELKAELDKANNESKLLAVRAEFGDKVATDLKNEVKRLYNIFSNGTPNDLIIGQIETANYELLQAYALQYGSQVVEKYGAVCNKCKGRDISFRSTDAEEETQKVKENTPNLTTMFK
jgi:hypothetical protein